MIVIITDRLEGGTLISIDMLQTTTNYLELEYNESEYNFIPDFNISDSPAPYDVAEFINLFSDWRDIKFEATLKMLSNACDMHDIAIVTWNSVNNELRLFFKATIKF